MHCCGCFLDALRAAFATIRNKIRRRGVRQRRRNYRITKMQAMEKMDQERDRGLKERVRSEVEVVESRAKTSKRDWRRARLVASGWKPRGEEKEMTRSKVQKKTFQESRKPQRVQLRAQRQKHVTSIVENGITEEEVLQVQAKAVETNNGHGSAKTSPLTYLSFEIRRPDMVLEGTSAIQEKMEEQSPVYDGEEERIETREQEMSLTEQKELPVPVEISTDSSSPTLSELGDNEQVKYEGQTPNKAHGTDLLNQAEMHLNNFDLRSDAGDGRLSTYVTLDDSSAATGDYSHNYYYSSLILIFIIVIILYFSY